MEGMGQPRRYPARKKELLREEAEGEVVAALHQLFLFLGQGDVLANILQRLAHVLSDEEDGTRATLADDVEEGTVGNERSIAWTC